MMKKLAVLLFFFFFFFLAFIQPVSALGALGQNYSFPNTDAWGGSLLADNFTYVRPLLSNDADNTFALGFVSTSSHGYTLSIFLYFPTKSFLTIVWSANRNDLVKENATLDFTLNLGFSLRDVDGRLVWSAQSSSAYGFEMQTLSGNLVLNDSRNATVWQSFEHPTDTLLPGQKFTTGLKLVSSISDTNLSEGSYSLVAEPGGLILYASLPYPQPYWTWGYYGLNDTQSVLHTCKNPTYALLSPLPSGFIYLSQDSNATSSSTSSVLCGLQAELPAFFITFPKNLTRYMLIEPDGNLRVYAWNEAWITDFDFLQGDRCLLPNFCGPYGICASGGQCSCPQDTTGLGDNFRVLKENAPSLGCMPPSNLTCHRDGAGQHLLQLQMGATYFPDRFSSMNVTTTLNECKNSCLLNCSCQAAFYDPFSSSCFVVQGLRTVRISSNQNMLGFIKAESSVKSSNSNQGSGNAAMVSSVTSVVVVIFIVLSIVIFWKCRSGQATEDEEEEALFLETLPGLPPRFSYKELEVATEEYSKKLGRGGFGTVYEGVMSMKSETGVAKAVKIAVKKLERVKQGSKEFRAEVATIGSLNHFNLVRLLGFCAQKSHRLLVYEYMANGSLDHWLFDGSGEQRNILDWDTRFKIVVGTARGIEYLHTECRDLIIHRDIKPHNILLDDRFVPKLSDFGLSKLVDRDQTSVVTAARGTPAYLAPECQESPSLTDKSDVYSFGLVLLETVGGRKNWDDSFEGSRCYFPEWALEKYQAGQVLELVDERLKGCSDEKQVVRVVGVALWCIQKIADLRPSMKNVVQMLEGVIHIPEPPPHIVLYFKETSKVSSSANQSFSGTKIEGKRSFYFNSSGMSSVPDSELLSCAR